MSEYYDHLLIARGALRLRVRAIGRPSQPDLGNTSVGKPEDIEPCEGSAAFPIVWVSGFFIVSVRMPLSASRVDNHERSSRMSIHTPNGSANGNGSAVPSSPLSTTPFPASRK